MNWAPIALILGISVYFGLQKEPQAVWGAAAFAISGLAAGVGLWLQRGAHQNWLWAAIPAFTLSLALAGFGLAARQTAHSAAPILAAPTSGPIAFEGWVEREEAGPRVRRIVIRTSWVDGLSGKDRPVRIQIAAPAGAGVTPGRYVRCFASLAPPQGPVTPSGYDFARNAFYRQIGASGYAITPCEPRAGPEAQPPGAELQLWLAAMRRATTDGILQSTGGGSAAGFVAALATGDQSAIAQDDSKSMQAAGLTHLVAVSGMNMALVGGFAFFAIRIGLSLLGSLPLYVNIRAIAAGAALITCFAYWALTGASASTTRAFVMAAIAFGAIMLDRPALTLRGLAISALAILLATPDAALSPGFQMSFAATLALVATLEADRTRRELSDEAPPSRLQRMLMIVTAAIVTSLVAGLATGPYSAYHFQTWSKYGLIANIAATPLIALVVTPALMLAMPAALVGLEEWPLRAAEWGAQQILVIAHWAHMQPGAIGAVAQFPPGWLMLFTFGFCALCLTHGAARIPGALVACIAILGAAQAPKPDAIIGAEGAIVARTPEGFLRSPGRADGFELQRLSQSIGAAPDAPVQIINEKTLPVEGGRLFKLRGGAIVSIANKGETLKDRCRKDADLIVIARWRSADPCSDAILLTRGELLKTGGVALYGERKLRIVTVRDKRGERPWSRTAP